MILAGTSFLQFSHYWTCGILDHLWHGNVLDHDWDTFAPQDSTCSWTRFFSERATQSHFGSGSNSGPVDLGKEGWICKCISASFLSWPANCQIAGGSRVYFQTTNRQLPNLIRVPNLHVFFETTKTYKDPWGWTRMVLADWPGPWKQQFWIVLRSI